MARANQRVVPAANCHMPGIVEQSTDPNTWFADKFPDAVKRYGPAFLERTWTDEHMQTRTRPIHLNIDLMAGVLGGDPALGHSVVYEPTESQWYFYDPLVDAYCITTAEKLHFLLSNYLMRCAQACNRTVDVQPLVMTFREKEVLKSITDRAKAILQAGHEFFHGPNGHRRFIEGRYINATDDPSYLQFARKALVARPDSQVTLPVLFQRYFQFCADNRLSPLTRSEFRHLLAETIRQEFNLGYRHDVIGPTGKAGHGWVGIDCLPIHSDDRKVCSTIYSEATEKKR